MHALAVTAREAPPAVVDVPDRTPEHGEALIAVEAASINGIGKIVVTR
jgi:NADPH:quinone reductase-like Zn-dependent oxidoreductase